MGEMYNTYKNHIIYLLGMFHLLFKKVCFTNNYTDKLGKM